jgi:ligand-binding sensor domain-containing protein/signal transduction histidine kinase
LTGLLLVFLAAKALASSGVSQYGSRLWQMDDGLPHSIVQAITQTQDGYLWVGTREGLARFDGVNFETIELSPTVRHPAIKALLAADDGSLWIATEDQGLFRMAHGQVRFCALPSDAKSPDVIQVVQGKAGVVWLNTSQGVLRWEKGVFKYLEGEGKDATAIAADGHGTLWAAEQTLKYIEGTQVKDYHPRQGNVTRAARELNVGADGTIWMGTAGSVTGVSNDVATCYQKCVGPAGFCSVILGSRAGDVWVGTYTGLSRLVNGKFVKAGSQNQSASYRVYCIYEDREDNIWVGSEEGLTRLTPRLFTDYNQQEGLSGNTVVSVCSMHDGSTWMAVWGGGLNHLQTDGQIVHYGASNGLSSDFVLALCEGRDGSLWAGTDWGAAISRFKDGKFTTYGSRAEMGGRTIDAIIENLDGAIWVGTRRELLVLKGGKFITYRTADGLADDWVNALCAGENKTVWIGTQGGLTRWNDGKFVNLAAGDPRLRACILSLYEDADHTLWIGTQGAGLISLKDGVVHCFTTRDGLFNDFIYAILEDDRKNLWLNSSKGIFRVGKAELAQVAGGEITGVNSVRYGKTDGIVSSGQYLYVSQPAACRGRDGRLWFRTTQGAVVVDPDKITANNVPPPIVIDAILADNKKVFSNAQGQPAGRPDLPFSIPQLSAAPLRVPPGRGELEIHYQALSFRAPEKNRYRYKLEGFDSDWRDVGPRQSAYYNNLRPGDYRFRVIACNNNEVWNESGATAEFLLAPHFWQTWWFLSLCGVTTVGGIGGGARYATRQKMQRKLERLQQQHAIEKERSRIARDMHDELGAKLTRISFQGATAQRRLNHPLEVREQIEKMSQTARDLASSLDEIVWAVDPENDSLDNLANYICRYASDFFESSPVNCEFVIPAKLPHHRLATDIRHNIFLAVKESLNNALKHSGAANVRIAISAAAEQFEIVIADDGCGMDRAAVGEPLDRRQRSGRGLVNLRERLRAINGRCELISEIGRGTRVRFIVPMREVCR